MPALAAEPAPKTPLPKKKLQGCGKNYANIKDHLLSRVADVGKMDQECPNCGALKFQGEPRGLCCSGGKVRIPILDGPEGPLKGLFSGKTQDSKHFLENIRQYNTAFSMTSMGGPNLDIGGWSTYKIQGPVYHRAGTLIPPEGKEPSYLQVYFIESHQDQARQRVRHNDKCKQNIVLDIQEHLHSVNPYVREFTTAMERIDSSCPNAKIVIQEEAPTGEHARRYNAPTSNDIGVIIKTDVGENSHERDIVLHQRDSGLVRIWDTHRSYDALQVSSKSNKLFIHCLDYVTF